MTEERRTRKDVKKQRQRQKKKQKKSVFTWIKRIVLSLIVLFVVGLISGAGLFAYYASSAPELDEELLKDPISSEFYDMNGELFAKIGVENRKYIEYEDIPQEMIHAILATEDVRFFDHFGMDLWRTMGAVVANITDGYGSQGGSTITQQVVKNSFLKNEKKLKRKAQEAWLAIQLERQYSKEEIFEMYFNKILMSGRIYGFGTASEQFFGKELHELELDEFALLAGMPQSPNNYNPFKHPERAEQRRNIVLDLMVQHGKITEQDAKDAKEIKVTSRVLPEEERKAVSGTKYDAFLDIVLSEIEEKGDGESLGDGLKVYTTLDPKAQSVVEDVINNPANFPTENIQSGISVVDTKTGAIRAVGGGRNYGAERGFNYAHDLKTRAPGSTMKPLLDYGPAIEHLKWSTGQTIVDEKMTYSGSKQVITNWDKKYFGKMTIREALYASRNIPAVKALQEVGLDKAQEFVEKLGITTDYVVESDAIGGGRINLSPIQMSAAYAAFGNNGVFNEPYSIKEIEYRDKSRKSYKPQPVVAMSDYTAYMVTDMLRDVVSTKPHASGKLAIVPGLDIAGKTGTTNYASDEFKKYNLPYSSVPDTWFSGYTTNYSISIWSGYESRSEPMTTMNERNLPQKLFKTIMSRISEDVSTPRFEKPSSVVEATIEVGTNPLKLASEFTPAELRRTELFVRGTEPKEVSNEYEEETVNAPTNLKANYKENVNEIELSWEYSHPIVESEDGEEPISKPVSFEVSMTMDNGTSTVITTTENTSLSIKDIELGRNYTFTVVAIMGETRSAPASVSLYIENAIVDPEIEEPQFDFEDEFDQNNGNNQGNSNNNGNGNGNGNGNSNNNGNNNNGQGSNDDSEVNNSIESPADPNAPQRPNN